MNTLETNIINYFYNKTQVLSNIPFSLSKGELICLCGPNGAGKSSLIKHVYEKNLVKNNWKALAKKISYLPQNEGSMWDYKVKDIILSGRFCHTGFLNEYSNYDYEIVSQIIKDFDLEKLKEKNINEISGGEFQKVRLARSFAQESDFLLLDEPLTALDFISSDSLMKFLKKKTRENNKGILVSLHDINTACRFADKITLIGKINQESKNQFHITGIPSEIITAKNIELSYGVTVKVYNHPLYNVPQVSI